ncbi:MAG: hypothetical protein HY271_09815 [Deltaproteobacteria bacterium]|nr:hypothetical protein [Deltaproteobacteria bacterium]
MLLVVAAVAAGVSSSTMCSAHEPAPATVGTSDGRERATRELEAALDRLVTLERAGGGWAAASAAGTRPQPSTAPLKLAERLAAPFGLARWDLVVLRSPGTPAAGLVLLDGYRLTGRAAYLAAAARAGDLLVAIQLPSGGWFSEVPVEGGALAPWFATTVGRTTLDDDVTPGATRLLLALWETTGETRYRAAAERALALLLRAQLPSGAFPLKWHPHWQRVLWPTSEDLATLNDGATTQALTTLLAGSRTLGRADLLAAARRAGEWLVQVRGALPQAGWAQQYDGADRPAPARRFEPAALASWESRYAIDALVTLAAATGDARYCAAIVDAIHWLAHSAIRRGCWARFYALGTNAPLYVGPDDRPVDTPGAARPGYDWTGDYGIPALFARLGIDAEGEGHGREVGGLSVPVVLVHHRPLPTDRIPGDAGHCPGAHPQGYDRYAPDDPRALVTHAAALLAALHPEPPVCAAALRAPTMERTVTTRQTPAAIHGNVYFKGKASEPPRRGSVDASAERLLKSSICGRRAALQTRCAARVGSPQRLPDGRGRRRRSRLRSDRVAAL